MSTKNLKKNEKLLHRRRSSQRPSRHHQRRSHAEDPIRQTTRRHGEMSKPDGSRQQKTTRRPMDTTPSATETSKQYIVEAAKQLTEATRCHPYHKPAGGLSEMWWERTLG